MQPSLAEPAPEVEAPVKQKRRRIAPAKAFTCQHCGKEAMTYRPTVAKWCSTACNWNAHRALGRYDRDCKCAICGEKFISRPNNAKQWRLTCTTECRNLLTSKRRSSLSAEAIRSIRAYLREGKSQAWIAQQFRCSQNVVSGIKGGKLHRWVPDESLLTNRPPK